jgi:hypothetical protein
VIVSGRDWQCPKISRRRAGRHITMIETSNAKAHRALGRIKSVN